MINKKRANNNNNNFNSAGNQNSLDSKYPPYDINYRFVDACENGDYPTVIRILEAIKDFNIDVTDNLGRSALRLAVENEHLEIVQALLDKSDSPKIKEALLLSIYIGHTQIAESILSHPKYKVLNDKKFQSGDTDSFWQTPSSDDAQFPPDITPLMLAAQYNRTEIVQILLINGDRITKPHDFHCKCNECINRFKFDSLRHAQSRLNAYRGLASEAYISLASIDPILTSFELGRELRILSTKEKYFKNEYLQVADNLSIYVCKLLNNVRGHAELEIVLNKTGKESEEKYSRLARLDLAIKYQEKPFVAHSNCQQKLVETWFSGISRVSKMNDSLLLLLILVFIAMIPFLSIVYIIHPNSKFGRMLNQPCVKFISHSIMYIVFIIMIIISSIHLASELRYSVKLSDYLNSTNSNNGDLYECYKKYVNKSDFLGYKIEIEDFHIRVDSPSVLDLLITTWVVGLIWQELRKLIVYGLRDYFHSWNGIVNIVQTVLYAASFGLRYYTMYMVKINKNKILSQEFWEKSLTHFNNTEVQKEIFETVYWLNNDRYFWVSNDPINMAEGLFAVANLFSFTRICFLLPASQELGPLQISLGNMISDVMKFLAIFLLIFCAFMFSLNNLYWYYQLATRKDVQTEYTNRLDIQTNAEDNFGSILLTLKTMFWALFGLGQTKDYKLEDKKEDKIKGQNFNSELTEFFGFTLYGFYHLTSIIILLNMLIASMTQSYEKILKESDIEWKFSRSKLYMEYIKEGASLPVPFNIIPTPLSFYNLVKKLSNLILKRGQNLKDPEEIEANTIQTTNGNTNGSIPNGLSKNKKNSHEELTYIIVMQRIVKRFLLHRDRENDMEINEMDFDELKQDLQMIRFEMNNDLKKSREDTSRVLNHINDGLLLIGEKVFDDISESNDLLDRFNQYKLTDLSMNDDDVIHDKITNIKNTVSHSSSTFYLNTHSNSKLSNDQDMKKINFSTLNSIKEE